jgi:hypothetical protein
VAIAVDQFRGTGVDARPHHQRWGDFLGGVSRWHFERIAVAVDSDGDLHGGAGFIAPVGCQLLDEAS